MTKLDSHLDQPSFLLGDLRLSDIQIHIPTGRGTKARQNLQIPLMLLLDPAQSFIGVPTDATTRNAQAKPSAAPRIAPKNDPVPPVANNDTASTDAGKPVVINVLANDTSNQTIDPTSIAIATNPTQRTIVVNGDGTDTVVGQSVNHIFANSGEYQATLTVTDDFGFSDTKTVTVYVGSTAPTSGEDSSLPDWNGDFNDIFSQFGNMS